MNILLVDKHRLVADAIKALLGTIEPDIEITACYSTQHALSILDSGKRFELLLIDLFMPGIDGVGLLLGLQSRRRRLPVVVVSGSEDDDYIRIAIEHGACGFIPKTLPGAVMITGLQQVLAGGRFFPEKFNRFEVKPPTKDDDNVIGINYSGVRPGKKQIQVLRLIADGNSNKQISQIVGISEATVKYHTAQLFKLLGVRNRTSCVLKAQQLGLISFVNSSLSSAVT